MTPAVKAAFEKLPDGPRADLMQVREMILGSGVTVEEALRWGQPAYLAKKGTTIRLGVTKAGLPSVFTHCQSSVMGDVQAVAGAGHNWDGNRGLSWTQGELPDEVLRLIIQRALGYHA